MSQRTVPGCGRAAMIWLYRCLFPLAFLVGLPFYARRMLKRGGYRQRFGDRFGFAPTPPPRRDGATLWFQAVSVGEVLAIEPVVRRLRTEHPDANLYLTTTTSTGFALLNTRDTGADWTGYFPIDFAPASTRFWRRLRPDLCILMEGELWPEHLHQACRRAVPVLLVNARLSDRSFRRYRALGPLGRGMFGMVSRILAASSEDAGRIRSIAPAAVEVETSGNLKFDVEFPPRPVGPARTAELRTLGLCENADEPPLLLLGSSTWPGEEEVLCRVLDQLLRTGTAAKLLLVPRHAERRADVCASVERSGLAFSLRSTDGPADPENPVYIADTTGELRRFTALADLAFIGKSLPPNDGGQTPIEAAAYGVPMVYGPGMTNFKAACRGLEAADAALRCETSENTAETLLELARDPGRRKEISDNAVRWHQANRGAVERTVAAIGAMITRRAGGPGPQ